jgi:hypothetical protein
MNETTLRPSELQQNVAKTPVDSTNKRLPKVTFCPAHIRARIPNETAQQLYLRLRKYARLGFYDPAIWWLARVLKVSVRTVQRWKQWLIRHGIIAAKERPFQGRGWKNDTTIFRILWWGVDKVVNKGFMVGKLTVTLKNLENLTTSTKSPAPDAGWSPFRVWWEQTRTNNAADRERMQRERAARRDRDAQDRERTRGQWEARARKFEEMRGWRMKEILQQARLIASQGLGYWRRPEPTPEELEAQRQADEQYRREARERDLQRQAGLRERRAAKMCDSVTMEA